jgi:hypothetical protein
LLRRFLRCWSRLALRNCRPRGRRSCRRSCSQLLRCSYCCHVVEHRAGTNRSFKNFIRISALEVLATSFDLIGPPISETQPVSRRLQSSLSFLSLWSP